MAFEKQSYVISCNEEAYKFALSPQAFDEPQKSGLDSDFDESCKFFAGKYNIQAAEPDASGLLLRRIHAGGEYLHLFTTDIFKLSMAAGCSLKSPWLSIVFLNPMSDIDLSSRIFDTN
ncbi:hypothetical protein RF11_04056 [Thelohanellus kitauei]|uniref:Uncharacterized protein n=1 Tax=Thelohanellus kitauei TaxID=669202 RepID=A0A0C2NC17_THEKT|nr:hypothetical protein RF11_04056 [Thelohanellus kitauei]